ncbi:MAG: GNAT family N-acetyltransferase [Lachnospiraceae bacterium]|nr:GNAT family N-acetyltransferase [Lachnospiraceae bacterium]
MGKPYLDFETERLHIRTVSEADRDAYMSLRVGNSTISVAYSAISGFEDFEWESELNDEKDIYLSVFIKDEEIFIASASLQDYQSDTIEMGYDVVEGYRNHGHATEIVH